MSYFFNDNSNQNEIYENEFFYNLSLEFPLFRKVYPHKNKVSYSKEKKIWFMRYKQKNNYIYLFGYNYGNDKQLDTKDPLLILKFNLFNAPNIGNGHFAVDNDSDEVRAVMNIQYANYNSNHKSENLKSILPINVNTKNYLDLGNIENGKELCKNIDILLDEIESIFFFNRHLNRIKNNTSIKKDNELKKQTNKTVKLKNQDILSKNIKEKDVEIPSEENVDPIVKIIKCDFCNSDIINEDPFKICKSCRIRIFNYMNLICNDLKLNTEIPIENFIKTAEKHEISQENIKDLINTLNKYRYLHKDDGKFVIYYNAELSNLIDKYSTKTEENDNLKNKINLLIKKIGFDTPFDIQYLKETLNFKNSEISKMIKYLDEKNAIIEDDEYYMLVDKSNEINGINDHIKPKDKTKINNEPNLITPPKTSNVEHDSINKKLNTEDEIKENKPTIKLKPMKINNKTDIEIFYESYEKVLTYMKNDVPLNKISDNLGISENRIKNWIKKGNENQNPYKLLSYGIKKNKHNDLPKISNNNWKQFIKYIQSGFSLTDAAQKLQIPYPLLQSYIIKGKQGEKDYKQFYEEYQNALTNHSEDKIKTHKKCHICNEILSDESKVICNDCETKKKFAIDLKILIEKLKDNNQFTKEDLIIYYSDNEILKLIKNLKKYDLILEDNSKNIYYLIKNHIENFLKFYFDSKNPDYIKHKTKHPQNIKLTKSQNKPYQFKSLNKDHTFLHKSDSSSKFTLEDVISIHKNYYEDLYSTEKIAKKMNLSELTIKKIIVRFDEGDFDRFIKLPENENIPSKIITSTKMEPYNDHYTTLIFTGKLCNNDVNSNLMNLLNKFKAVKKEIKLMPKNENENEIIFNLITKNNHTQTNIALLKKYDWYFEK